MRRILVFTTLLIMTVLACKKTDETIIVTNGLYTESLPAPGRSQLNFISETLVVRIERGSTYKDTFSYIITSGKISLKPTWTNQYQPQLFDFQKIDENTISIENLYPSIPEAPKSYMTYKR